MLSRAHPAAGGVGAFGFAALAARLEAELVAGLGLVPLPLAPALARADGRWKGEPVRIETAAYAGGAIRYARVARVTGAALDIANVLCLPRLDRALPVLGADLVAASARRGMVAADLSPTLPPGPERDAQLAPLAALAATHAALPPGGDLPAWCAAWVSPWALYTRVDAGGAPAARAAVRRIVRTFVDLGRVARVPRPEFAAHSAVAQDGYAAAHRADDTGLAMLAKMFGSAWAARYVADVLFPPTSSDAC